MENIFYIENVPIEITNIAPKTINEAENNKVIEIETTYLIKIPTNSEFEDLCFRKKIIINVSNLDLGEFIPIEDLTKVNFYPESIKQATTNEDILKTVKKYKYLTGMEKQPIDDRQPTNESNIDKNINLKLKSFK